MYRLFITFVAIVCIGLTSCSRVFWVKASGSINTGIQFEFFEDPDRSSPARLQVTEVSVVKYDQDRNASEQWLLTGRARLSTVEYGVVPKGLTEHIQAEALLAGGVYEVRVHDDPAIPPPANGGTMFKLTETGTVIDCRTYLECSDDK